MSAAARMGRGCMVKVLPEPVCKHAHGHAHTIRHVGFNSSCERMPACGQ